MRDENELRAAFAAKADEAPSAQDVLRAVRRREAIRRSRRPRWQLAAAGAAVAALAVAGGLGLTHLHPNSSNSKAGTAARGQAEAVSSAARSTRPLVPGEAGAAGGSADAAASPCRPDQVTVSVHRVSATRAALTVTAHGSGCVLARVPQVGWTGAGSTLGAGPAPPPLSGNSAGSSAGGSLRPSLPPGRLAAGATATATLTWGGGCALPSGTVTVDWGAGAVTTPLASPNVATCRVPSGLRIGPFAGLS